MLQDASGLREGGGRREREEERVEKGGSKMGVDQVMCACTSSS